MLRRAVTLLVACTFALVIGLGTRPALAQYRGMTPGWPAYSSGYYAAYAPSYGHSQAYAAARPVQYAYANPAYYPAYQQAQYQQPAVAYYAPAQQAYAPTAAYYAPAGSYTVSPAGNVSAGAEAYAGYGQPTRVNYVPPRFAYRTVYSPVTVYSYRPVTAYQPITAQPTTCLQPAVTTACQPARQPLHCCWWLNPCNWFSHHWGHWGSSGCCGAPAAPTAAYCGSYAATTCGTAGCAQPYYPVQPVVPVVPVPAVTAPAVGVPSIRSPIIGTPTVPAPPTRFNTAPGTVIPGTVVPGVPADTRPTLPGGSFTPGGSGGSFNPAPGSFGSGSNYPPAIDPYSNSSNTPGTSSVPSSSVTSNPTSKPTTSSTTSKEPARGSFPTDPRELEMTGPQLRQPGVAGASALHPDVQPVPDPAAQQSPKASNRAPQLLDPRDKSARRGDVRWAVVPAVWPKKAATVQYEQRSLTEMTTVKPAAAVIDPAQYDDGGWKAAGF